MRRGWQQRDRTLPPSPYPLPLPLREGVGGKRWSSIDRAGSPHRPSVYRWSMSSGDMVRRARERVGTGPRPDKLPSSGLAVVTCMDTRVDPLRVFGSRPGEIHTIENAGGLVTGDVIRSLLVSQRYLGTRKVAIVMHTDCGLLGLDDQAEASAIADELGVTLPFNLGGFTDLRDRLAESVRAARTTPLLLHRGRRTRIHLRREHPAFDRSPNRLTDVSCGATLPVGPVAQLAEQGTFNPKVVGSIPTGPTRRTRHPAIRPRLLDLGIWGPPGDSS